MLRLNQIIEIYTKETKKEAIKRTEEVISPWMHEQMKRTLLMNRQRVITSK